jgi:hypothetical protein
MASENDMKLSPIAPRPGDQVSVDKREKAIGRPVTFLEVIERERAVLKHQAKTQERLDEVQSVCAEAIQVVGHMLVQLGIFGTDDATYILDRLSAAANDAATEIPPERAEGWLSKPLPDLRAEDKKALEDEIRSLRERLWSLETCIVNVATCEECVPCDADLEVLEAYDFVRAAREDQP